MNEWMNESINQSSVSRTAYLPLKIRSFTGIFINIAKAIVKCQNSHKKSVLLHHLMYANIFRDWNTSSEYYFDEILSCSKN